LPLVKRTEKISLEKIGSVEEETNDQETFDEKVVADEMDFLIEDEENW